jgi:hypothetical protein
MFECEFILIRHVSLSRPNILFCIYFNTLSAFVFEKFELKTPENLGSNFDTRQRGDINLIFSSSGIKGWLASSTRFSKNVENCPFSYKEKKIF